MINGLGKATESMINQFENKIGFKLTEDYKQFLRDCNGGLPKVTYSYFCIKDLNENVPLNALFGLNTDHRQSNLEAWFDEYVDDLMPNSLIVGDAGAGMVVLINDPEDSENNGIYFWDDAYNFEQSSDEGNIYFITSSFQEFINSLKEPEE